MVNVVKIPLLAGRIPIGHTSSQPITLPAGVRYPLVFNMTFTQNVTFNIDNMIGGQWANDWVSKALTTGLSPYSLQLGWLVSTFKIRLVATVEGVAHVDLLYEVET